MKSTKTRILEETAKCIGTLGSDRTNARVVAQRLKMRPSNVFYYFPKQEQLFEATMSFIVDISHATVAAKIAKIKSNKQTDRILCYLEGHLEWAAKQPDHVAAMMFGYTSAVHNKQIATLVKAVLANGEETLYQFLAIGVAEKEFELKSNIRDAAKSLHQFLTGCIVIMFAKGNRDELADYERRVKEFFSNLLRSVP